MASHETESQGPVVNDEKPVGSYETARVSRLDTTDSAWEGSTFDERKGAPTAKKRASGASWIRASTPPAPESRAVVPSSGGLSLAVVFAISVGAGAAVAMLVVMAIVLFS